MKHLLSIIFILVVFTSCHSTKNISSIETADTNTIATHSVNAHSNYIDSLFSQVAIELDSFDINAEPMVLINRDSTRSAVVAYRYHIKANSGTINTKKSAVSRSADDTLLTDSVTSHCSRKESVDNTSESTGVYKPPNGLAIFIITIVIIIIVFFILWKIRK